MSSWSSSTSTAPRASAQARCLAAPTPLIESSTTIRSRASSRAGRQRAPELSSTTHSQSSQVCATRLSKHSSRNRGWCVTVKTLTRGPLLIGVSPLVVLRCLDGRQTLVEHNRASPRLCRTALVAKAPVNETLAQVRRRGLWVDRGDLLVQRQRRVRIFPLKQNRLVVHGGCVPRID